MNPNSAKKATVTDADAAEKRRSPNRRTSSIGVRLCSSHATRPASSSADAANPAIVTVSSHPRLGASMIV